MLRRPHRVLFALALFLVVWGAKLAVIDRFGTDLPFWDQWAKEGSFVYVPWFEKHELWANLFKPHNEHRIAPTLAVNLALVLATGQWDARVQCALSGATHALVLAGVFWWAMRRWTRGWALGLGGLLALVGALPIAWENLTSGFQSQFYFLAGFSLLAIGGLLGAPAFSLRWWGGLAAGALALVSMGSGLLCAPVIALMAAWRWVRREGPRRDAIATLLAAGALGALGLALHAAAPWHESLHARTPCAFLLYVARCLAWPWPWQPWLAAIVWAPWLGLAAGEFFRGRGIMPRHPPTRQDASSTVEARENPIAPFILAGGLWVLAQIAAVSYSRAGTGEMPASRYGDLCGIGLALNFCALAALAARTRVVKWLALLWAGGAIALLAFATHAALGEPLTNKKTDHAAYERNLAHFVLTNDYAAFEKEPLPFPSADWLAQVLRHPALRPLLPASVRAPIAIEGFGGDEVSGPPSLAPRRTRAVAGAGEWRSPLLPAGRGWWKFETAGSIGLPGTTLELLARDGRVLERIAPTKLPGNSWRAAYVRAPREPVFLVARNHSAGRWLAFTEPVEMSTLGYCTWRLGQQAGWLVLAGLMLGVIAVFASSPRSPRAWAAHAGGSFCGRLAAAALTSVAIALALTPGLRPGTAAFTLELRLRTSVYSAVQAYFDHGAGLDEADSVRADLEPAGELTTLRFPLPAGDYHSLRLDPIDRPGRVTLASVRILAADGSLRREIAREEIQPAQQIARLEPAAEGVELVTAPDANDPQLAIAFAPPLTLRLTAGEIAAAALPRALICFAALAALWLAFARRAWLGLLLGSETGPLDRARVTALLAALFLAIWGVKLVVIDRFGSDIPYWDQWLRETIALFVPYDEHGDVWRNVFAAHNEHRIAPTLLLNLGLVVGGGQWDARVQCIVNGALHALVAVGLLAWAVRRWPGRWSLFAAVMLALIFAPPIASENILAGFQSQFYFLIGFSLLAIGGLLAPAFSRWWWIGLAAALLAIVSMGSGFLCVGPVVAMVAWRAWRGRRGRALVVTLAAAAVVAGIGLWQRPSAPWHADMHAHGVGEFLAYAARCLAWPLREEPWAAPVLWAPWLALLWRSFRGNTDEPTPETEFVIAGGLWVLLQVAAVSYARGGGTILPPTRYGDVCATGLVFSLCAFVLLMRTVHTRVRGLLAVAWAAAAIASLAVATVIVWRTDMRSKKRENTAMERNVGAYLLNGDLARLAEEPRAFPVPEDLASVLRNPFVRARLPAGIAPPLDLPDISARAEAPLPPLEHREIRVLDRAGEWRSGELPATSDGWWKIETAGHLGETGTRLEIVARADGRVLGIIAPSKPPGSSWRAAYVRAPREPALLVARTDAPERWFAFSEPVWMSAPSHTAWQLAKYGAWTALAGVLLALAVAVSLWRGRRAKSLVA